MSRRIGALCLFVVVLMASVGLAQQPPQAPTAQAITVIKAGKLVDPDTGTAAANSKQSFRLVGSGRNGRSASQSGAMCIVCTSSANPL